MDDNTSYCRRLAGCYQVCNGRGGQSGGPCCTRSGPLATVDQGQTQFHLRLSKHELEQVNETHVSLEWETQRKGERTLNMQDRPSRWYVRIYSTLYLVEAVSILWENSSTKTCEFFIFVAFADREAERTHQEATLHCGQERADQRFLGVGLLWRDWNGAGMADEPR